jgi:hypothetical protein
VLALAFAFGLELEGLVVGASVLCVRRLSC